MIFIKPLTSTFTRACVPLWASDCVELLEPLLPSVVASTDQNRHLIIIGPYLGGEVITSIGGEVRTSPPDCDHRGSLVPARLENRGRRGGTPSP